MTNLKTASSRELLPISSIVEWAATALSCLGLRRRRLSSTGQPIPRLARQHLALLDGTFDAIFIIGEQGKVRGANAAACELFGGSFAAFEGLSAATFFSSPGSEQPAAEFDPAHYLRPARAAALGLDCRSFAAELRSSEIELNGAHHYLLCVREVAQ